MKRKARVSVICSTLATSATLLFNLACGQSHDQYSPIGPFNPPQDRTFETRAISGLPEDVVCYRHSWQGLDENLWVEYIVRDGQTLYVSRKVGKFTHLTLNPFSPLNPVVSACATIETGLENEVGQFSPKLREWLLKCMSEYFSDRAVDSVFTEGNMSYRFINKDGDVFIDYARPQTMSGLPTAYLHN